MAENILLNEIQGSQDNIGPDISPIKPRFKASIRSEKKIISENSSENRSINKKNRSIRFTDECKYIFIHNFSARKY